MPELRAQIKIKRKATTAKATSESVSLEPLFIEILGRVITETRDLCIQQQTEPHKYTCLLYCAKL